MDCSPPGSSVQGILQARIVEWVAMPSSRGSSPPRNRTQVSSVSCTASGFFTTEAPRNRTYCIPCGVATSQNRHVGGAFHSESLSARPGFYSDNRWPCLLLCCVWALGASTVGWELRIPSSVVDPAVHSFVESTLELGRIFLYSTLFSLAPIFFRSMLRFTMILDLQKSPKQNMKTSLPAVQGLRLLCSQCSGGPGSNPG